MTDRHAICSWPTYYLGGPMRGSKGFNYLAFDAAAADLRERCIHIVSPAEQDSAADRAIYMASPDGKEIKTGKTWADFLAHDVKLIADKIDGVVVLPGWEKSQGAKLETFISILCNKPVLRYPDLDEVHPGELMQAWRPSQWEDLIGFLIFDSANTAYAYDQWIIREMIS